MNATRTAFLSILFLMAGFNIGCNQNSQPTVKIPQQVVPVKHYHLKGKVVSIDTRAKMVNIDSEAVPGFMDAMTMPYQIKPENELQKLHAGDCITADLIVQDEKAWLENISIGKN